MDINKPLKHKYFLCPVRIEYNKYDDFFDLISSRIEHKTFGNIKIGELFYHCCDYRRNMANDEWFIKFDFWCAEEDDSDFLGNEVHEVIKDTVEKFAY